MLDEMGIVQADQDSWTSSDEDEEDEDHTLHWRCMMVLGRWLRLCNKMRYGKQQKARQASWISLTDALLLHNAVEALVPLVEAQAQVWLATVDSGHKVRVRRPLDVVILDEAGSMPEWKMPLLTRFKPRLLLLVGDHKQLPPFTSCEGGFRPVSVLERMADVLSSTAMPVKMLTTQYRMHPNICRFVSAHFYNKRLETDQSRARAAREQPGAPIVWRTHGGGESRAEHSTSTENREEARIICGEILPALFADPHYAGKKIVIITMYKAQLRLLEQMLTEHQHTGKAAVMTVDSAQGSEADIVILSLVRSNARENIGHVRDRQRINVALSRAKDRLLIVGNAQCFRSDRVWRDLWRAASHVHTESS
jgi:superfamily I DNA and/or RNA helicase